jgi:antitoxin component YwqK of YwqJK toxin-antitoxin module
MPCAGLIHYKMRKGKLLVLIILFSGICFPVICQDSPEKEKIKSIIVLEERNDMLIKKPLTESETYFDEKGNIIEEIEYKQGKVSIHFKYQYDKAGNKIREEDYDPSGKLREYSEYKIENGLRMEKIVYNPDGKVILKKIYKYTTY